MKTANNKPTVLRTDAELEMGASWSNQSSSHFKLVTAPDDNPETLVRCAADVDVIFTCYAPISSRVIAASRRLKGIVKYGVGVDNIDLEFAALHRIPVVNCPDYGTDTVADQAFALLIAVARKTNIIDQNMRERGWLWPEDRWQGIDLSKKTLGLIGFGRIGRAMARRAAGFGMRCLVFDPYVQHDIEGWSKLDFAPLEKVIQDADFLSLHCVLTEETRQILNENSLAQMKKNAIVVNVSRGALIDENALIDALKSGRLAGAGLDVFVDEPIHREHPLNQMDNVVISPHFAFYTTEAHQRLEQECLNAITAILDGKKLANVRNTSLFAQKSENRQSGETLATWTAESCDLTEGDINLTKQRSEWLEENIGPETRTQLDRDARTFFHQSLSTPCFNVLAECEGSYLIDDSGRKYLDFHGNSAHQVGYRHPQVIDAVKAQLDSLPFCPRRYTNRSAIQLAEKLGELAPGDLNKVLFTPSGTSAIGIALKIARYVTGCYKTISMWGSFHGASLDAISIGGEELFRGGLGPLMPGCFHVDWPDSLRDAEAIEKILFEQGDIAAVIAEPMRCTTVNRPPAQYWQRVRELCNHHGALLIFDEIPTALGRTGHWFCCNYAEVVPDILVIGKGLGGGVIPMAAVIADSKHDICSNRALGHYTHEKSSTGAAAAIATINVIESEGLLKRSQELGSYALKRLQQIVDENDVAKEARGFGLSLALELNSAPEFCQEIMYRCLQQGLSFKVSNGNVLTLTPPLTISPEELDQALNIVSAVISDS